MKKIKLIYNSIAGQSKFKYFLDTIIEKFIKNDFDVSIFRAGKGTNLDEYIKNIDKDTYGIIVAGGDGTINRVINSMMKNNVKIPLGIIPAGTSNDFAKHIRMPKKFSKCIDKILEGNIQDVDVGLVNGKYFINVCSYGLFSDTSQKVDVALKNLIGKLSYYIAGLKSMLSFKPFDVKIETDTETFVEKICLFLIFNGSSVGGMNIATEGSSIQDGMFDVVIFKYKYGLQVAWLLLKVLMGKRFIDENVIYLREKNIKVTKFDKEEGCPDIDGDKGPEFPMYVTCVEKGLKMFL